jgi:hypothetical protein
MDRKMINSLLVKLGVEAASLEKMSTERATIKLRKRLAASGALSDGVSAEERELANKIMAEPPTEAKESTTGPAASADTEKRWYKLPGIKGQEDRVEFLSPSLVAIRNGRYKDGRAWEPCDPPADAKEDKGAGDAERPSKKAMRKGKERREADAKSAAKAAGETNTKRKADIKKSDKKTPKPKAEKGKPRPRTGATDFFRECFEGGKEINKTDLVEKLVGRGVAEGTARSYIAWAKRAKSGTPDKANPFGFQIGETVNKNGDKLLKKIKNLK